MTTKWQRENREAYNEMWRRWYRDNARRKIEWQKRRLDDLREWWRALKATKRCEECGERAPECLHFHHIDPTTKSFDLGAGASTGRSKAAVLAEVAKCRLLCANCHFKHHWDEAGKGSG